MRGRPTIDPMEAEANAFAMELLMPEEWLRKDIAGGFDIEDDAKLKKLAKKYGVSMQVMALRIGQLMDRDQ